MFKVNDEVWIRGTDELPTSLMGKATILGIDYMGYTGFYLVLVWNRGDTVVLHESQLHQL